MASAVVRDGVLAIHRPQHGSEGCLLVQLLST
jgi:hypothetical protein